MLVDLFIVLMMLSAAKILSRSLLPVRATKAIATSRRRNPLLRHKTKTAATKLTATFQLLVLKLTKIPYRLL